LTTKIHMLADALGRPLRFALTAGQAHDILTAPALLEGMEGGAVIADKAYDTNDLRQRIADAGMRAVIPSKRSRKLAIPHDATLYKARNRIERCFNKLKHSDALQRALTAAPSISSLSSTSPPPCYGCGECQFSLALTPSLRRRSRLFEPGDWLAARFETH
jgi:transposase